MSDEREIEARVRSIVREITRRDASTTTRDDDLVEAMGIDSLQGLQILATVEKRLAVRLPDDQLAEMRTIGRIVDAVRAHQAESVS